jgi:hypothetical protein
VGGPSEPLQQQGGVTKGPAEHTHGGVGGKLGSPLINGAAGLFQLGRTGVSFLRCVPSGMTRPQAERSPLALLASLTQSIAVGGGPTGNLWTVRGLSAPRPTGIFELLLKV